MISVSPQQDTNLTAERDLHHGAMDPQDEPEDDDKMGSRRGLTQNGQARRFRLKPR
ncbi:hypothetical protein BH11PSE1_BH11PSE1_21510 [soil metagenome]